MPHLPVLPRLPLVLAVFLLELHVHASHGAPVLPPTYDRSMCSDSFRCGSVEIRYPFHLSNATAGDTTPYSCGYTDLNITCQAAGEGADWTPTIQLGQGSYTVLSIAYDTSTVILADADAFGSAGSAGCPRVRHNFTLGPQWLNYTASRANLTFFFGCYSSGGPVPGGLDAYRISCPDSGGSPGGGFSFVFAFDPEKHDETDDHDLERHCSEVVVAPVQRDSPLLRGDNRSTLPRGYGDVLRQGFELVWSPMATDGCHLCEQPGSGGGRCAYGRSRGFLSCLCPDGTVGVQDCRTPRSKKPRTGIIAGASAAAGAIVLSAAIFLFIRKSKQKKVINSSSKLLKYSGSGGTPRSPGGDMRSRGGDMESGSVQDLQTHLFSYEELEEATDRFNDNRELGDGGFGTVYKGYLKDGRVVAVKRLYNNSYRRVEQFVNEAAILSRLRHPNLVMFYGCTSSHSRDLLLVYEFVANGTVADHLHGHRAPERALSWPLRLNIAVESAAALTYLHAIEPPIVHRDVKTTNILLDADFHVKVADFGLSRLFPLDVTHVSTAPQGTPGYVDPEYHQCYQLTDKSDVYSFGVVLVELISSKPAVDITRHRDEINLAGMAISKIQKCQLEQLVDIELGYETDPATKKMMTMVAELAFRCLQHNGEMRPPIKEVLEVLKGIQCECRVEKDGDKDAAGPFSPNTVHAPWDSRATTPNTSQ